MEHHPKSVNAEAVGGSYAGALTRKQRWIAIAITVFVAGPTMLKALAARSMFDFAYLLVAGRMWAAGADPYGEAFPTAGIGLLPPDAAAFFYPPNWWPIAVSIATLSDGTALTVWTLLNVAVTGAAGVLLVRSAARLQKQACGWWVCLFFICIFGSEETANALSLGQTSLIVLLGFALLVDGLTRRRWVTQSAGLTLLMLKPQIGLLFLLLALTRREYRQAAWAALIVTFVACLPILIAFGPIGTTKSALALLQNLSSYAQSPWNWPNHSSGLPHLGALAGLYIPPVAGLLAAWGMAELIIRRAPQRDHESRVIAFWIVSLGALLSFAPLHFYDFVLCFSPLLLLPRMEHRSRNLLGLSLVLGWSAGSLARIAFLQSGASPDAFWLGITVKHGAVTACGFAILAASVQTARKLPLLRSAVNDDSFAKSTRNSLSPARSGKLAELSPQ